MVVYAFTEEYYSMSFEESVTEDESFKGGRPSDRDRRDAKRRKNKPSLSDDRKHLSHFDLHGKYESVMISVWLSR